MLTEVAKQILPPASGRLRVAAHHLDPGPDQPLVGLCGAHRFSHRPVGYGNGINEAVLMHQCNCRSGVAVFGRAVSEHLVGMVARTSREHWS